MGWAKIGGDRLYTLAYADDIVVLAEEEGQMRSMMRRLWCYLRGKNLEVNNAKTKIMRFRRGGEREKRIRWWWNAKEVEEVQEFCHLGYKLQKNWGQEAHI